MDTQELLKTPEWVAEDSNGAGLTQAARLLDDSEEEVPFESGSPFQGFPSENGPAADHDSLRDTLPEFEIVSEERRQHVLSGRQLFFIPYLLCARQNRRIYAAED